MGVKTTLVPPTDRWPDWHVHVHRIRRESLTSALILSVSSNISTIARLIMKPDSNTNLTCQRTLIPTIRYIVLNVSSDSEIVVVNGIFAISSKANGGRALSCKTLAQRWAGPPVIRLENATEPIQEHGKLLDAVILLP